MTDAIRKSLEETLGPAEWSLLRDHVIRGALLWVSPELNLLEVGTVIAKDDTQTVMSWIQSGMVTKPTAEQFNDWERTPSRTFLSVIVQPYVLMQEWKN